MHQFYVWQLPCDANPSCLQTTVASKSSQSTPQIVFQPPSKQTWSLPFVGSVESLSRIALSVHTSVKLCNQLNILSITFIGDSLIPRPIPVFLMLYMLKIKIREAGIKANYCYDIHYTFMITLQASSNCLTTHSRKLKRTLRDVATDVIARAIQWLQKEAIVRDRECCIRPNCCIGLKNWTLN